MWALPQNELCLCTVLEAHDGLKFSDDRDFLEKMKELWKRFGPAGGAVRVRERADKTATFHSIWEQINGVNSQIDKTVPWWWGPQATLIQSSDPGQG